MHGNVERLSRREREIMDVVYARRSATVADVRAALLNAPGYSAVRATMRILERKGFLRHEQVGASYRYRPTVPRGRAAESAIRRFLDAYFDGSLDLAVASLINVGRRRLTDADYERLLQTIRKARSEGT